MSEPSASECRGVGISLRSVTKIFGAFTAVNDVSLDIAPGEFLVILGPSGCGKSTLLRLVAGLESVTSGSMLMGGADITALPPADRRLSMVFQSYALSVRENIVFGLRLRKRGAQEVAERLEIASRLLGLGELLDRKPSELSGGQQQRVALGRAIVSKKPVCLMDEPLSNLDAKLRNSMRREIHALQRTLGITMIYVTHDQVEAMTMADRVALLDGGRLVQHATPAELYSRPQTVFAARFIGTPPMNLVPLYEAEGGAALEPGGAVVLPGVPGKGVLLGVRPEDIVLAPGGLPARVLDTEFLGADLLARCALAGGEVLVRLPGKREVAGGDGVRLVLPPQALHFFDAASGRRRDDILCGA
jgi:sn-glycerol 3-phosphate transport system ATP-binding protein